MSPRASWSVHLLWGEDAYLLREAAAAILGDELEVTEVDAAAWRGGELADLSTPSLFGERRALVVTDCRSLPEEGHRELAAYLAAPDPDAPLVLLVTVRDRGTVPAALRKLVEPVGEVREVKLTRKELTGWLMDRATATQTDLAGEAAAALIDVLGEDPATLVSAVAQLRSAFPDRRITAEDARSQFRGLGEQKTWTLCDRLFERDVAAAMRALRSLRASGEAGLAILSPVATRVRELIRLKELPDRMSDADAARAAGLRFDWQARNYRRQAARFGLGELVEAHERIVEADRALKSGADEDVLLPLLVAGIARSDAA